VPGLASPKQGLSLRGWATGAATVGTVQVAARLLPKRFQVPASLAGASVMSVLAAKKGADFKHQGLSADDAARGVVFGVAAAIPIAAVIGAGHSFGPSRALYKSNHALTASTGRAAYEVCVRIPLGTALPEEIVFRGAVLGLLSRQHGRLRATAISSLLFGLWHIAPVLTSPEGSLPFDRHRLLGRTTWILGSIVATAASGFLLCWLRFRSASIVAPWMAHTAANATGFAVGWSNRGFAERRERSAGQPSSVSTEAMSGEAAQRSSGPFGGGRAGRAHIGMDG
jgi:membrane protease YdiL (CAAX protease family)